MKKIVLSAAALAALAFGGAAQADLIDSVGNGISRIFGVPYDASVPGTVVAQDAPTHVYRDAYGRTFYIDPSTGQHLQYGQASTYRDQWGRTVHLGANNQPMYIEENGRLIPYGAYARGSSGDRDGDGVANRYDRAPNDARYR